MSGGERWLTTGEVAALPWVRRTAYTIRRHIRQGQLKARKDPVSGRLLVLEADVIATYGTGQPSRKTAASIDAPGNFRGSVLLG